MNRYYPYLIRFLIAAAVLSALSAAIFLGYDYWKTHASFPPRTYIGQIDVSLLNRSQAIKKIEEAPEELLFPSQVTFVNSRESFSFPPEELGMAVLVEDTVDQAFRLTHNENYLGELQKRLAREAIVLPFKWALDDHQARAIISQLALSIDSPPKDARIELIEETGGYHIYPDLPARKLKIADTLSSAKKELARGLTKVHLIIDYHSKPRVTAALLRSAPPVHRLSAYTTYYGTHDSPNRIHNIKLIASWLNNTLILSGETFSVSETIGDFTAERGFKEAFVIVGSELVPQLGGGTCQIGTTLYNAVSLADLEILSRRNHSFYFNIYPLGRDAAIYPGSADLKFRNDSGRPILIKALATNRKLSFRIYGTPTGKKVDFSAPKIFLLGPGGFSPSTLRAAIATDYPFRTVVRRTVKDSTGKIIKEEDIRSYYKLYGEKTNVPIRRPEPR